MPLINPTSHDSSIKMLKTFSILTLSYKKWQDYFLPLVDQGIRQPKSYDNNIICIFYICILSKNILFVNSLNYLTNDNNYSFIKLLLYARIKLKTLSVKITCVIKK